MVQIFQKKTKSVSVAYGNHETNQARLRNMDEDNILVGCNYFESVEFDRVNTKVDFYNSCGFFRRFLFGLFYGRKFIPTQNEKDLIYWYNKSEVKKYG